MVPYLTGRSNTKGFLFEVFMGKKLLFGVGINDADYVVQPTVNGKQVICPFYQYWKHMLERCYDAKCQAKHPTYTDCIVAPEWLLFSNFKSWAESQDWLGKELDKDIIANGNKVYSSDTCAFIDTMTNLFTTERAAARGDLPIGVCFHRGVGKFQTQCRNPFTKKREYLGLFDCPNQAHIAWKTKKHQLACMLADLQTDKRVADALRTRHL